MSGQAHGANDIPIEVLTSNHSCSQCGRSTNRHGKSFSHCSYHYLLDGISIDDHVSAMVRLDDAAEAITDWIEAHGCAHTIVDICDLHRQPRIVFQNCAALALALDGTNVPIRISTYYGQPFYQAFDNGIELIALEPLNR